LPTAAADELHAAFGRYASATRFRWKVRIRALSTQDSGVPNAAAAVVRIDLSHDDARALAGILLHVADPDDGPGPRGPIGTWIGSEAVARRIGVAPSTIRGWIARNGPKAHPFPQPDARYRGRNYWQKRTIDRWDARQRRLDRQR
jgi:hypothetical protein